MIRQCAAQLRTGPSVIRAQADTTSDRVVPSPPGEPGIDRCPVIQAFIDAWREGLPRSQRQILAPLRVLTARSRASTSVEERRGLMAADWLVRTCAPVWLNLAGLHQQACLLHGLTEITDMAQAGDLRDMLARISRQADAAAVAVTEADWIKASDDCWACAWAAAFDAARLAAGDMAWISGAAAIRAAAGIAAREASRPHVAALQMTAARLVERMASLGRGLAVEHDAAAPRLRRPHLLENSA